MTYPNAFSHWVEMEITPETRTTLDIRSGASTLDEARARIAAEKAKGAPFASRRFRIVDRERRLIEAIAS